MCDLTSKWTAPAVTGHIVALMFASATYELKASMRFDANTLASEVRLVGNNTLVRAPTGSPLLQMLPGTPPVVLHGLTLQGQLDVRAGVLQMEACALEEGRSLSNGGALTLSGVAHVEARSTVFRRNTAPHGGAIHVNGGDLLLDACHVVDNEAAADGGAIHVQNGSVVLRNGTLLKGNRAGRDGKSLLVVDGSVDYTLPCPLGRYIRAAPGTDSMRVTKREDHDFPYAYQPIFERRTKCPAVCSTG